MKTITSRENEQLKRARALHQRKNREGQQRILVEGIRNLLALQDSGIEVEEVWISERSVKLFDIELLRRLLAMAKMSFQVSDELLQGLAGTEQSQGVVGIISWAALPAYSDPPKPKILLLDQIQDPGNAGALIRVAAAVGCHAVFAIKGTVDLFNEKTIRSAMGGVFQIPIRSGLSYEYVIKWAGDNRIPIIASVLDGAANYEKMKGHDSFLWTVGNEGNGMNPKLVKAADFHYKIPLENHVESLNVATAAAVLLYHNKYLLEIKK